MRQVEHEELSALLDGELDAQRAQEVRAAIGADPALGREYNALARLDERLWSSVEEAAFAPTVSFPREVATHSPAWRWAVGFVAVLALLATRLLPKLVEEPFFDVGLHVAAFAAISVMVITLARETQPFATGAFREGT